MKYFRVSDEVFEKLPDYCLGTVVVRDFENSACIPEIDSMLDENTAVFAKKHEGENVREIPGIKACRDAFLALSMNPNKFMVSIEALAKRVQKGNELPHINPLVDLGNALSVKHEVPMGAHDIDKMEADFEVRFSTSSDTFLPMGEEEKEIMPEGELCYVSGNQVKTRRWMWRQSDDGKLTESTKNVFFPIDGFASVNKEDVIAARDELAAFLHDVLGLKTEKGFVDKESRSVKIG